MNKFSHLMKETKSSAQRTAYTRPSPKKAGLAQFASNHSPRKAPKSPKKSNLVQFGESNGIINLRSTPSKDAL